jgi:hypothetical protein
MNLDKQDIRQILALTCGFIFMVITLGYAFSHGFKEEIPMSYSSIIAGVFLFYFLKEPIQNMKLKIGGGKEKE